VEQHAVHYYDDEARFIDLVSGYLADGLQAGEHAAVIATSPHRHALEEALESRIDVKAACESGSLTMHDAALTLNLFMKDGQPDGRRFEASVKRLLADADGRPVQAFGEMVALLWEQGNVPAAIRLEELWNELLGRERVSLWCAYPTTALTGASLGELNQVCHLHSRVLAPSGYDSGTAVPEEERWPGLEDLVDLRSTVFVPAVEAVGATRRFVAATLEAWGLDRLEWDAAQVVSELANNAVCHAGSPFRVLVRRVPDGVRIGVQDAGLLEPRTQQAADDAVDGRGMAIIAALSEDWGCDRLADGKFTWADLAIPVA
jgi:anti-sigma regulatory factor (Ser/Thr protein kinase)